MEKSPYINSENGLKKTVYKFISEKQNLTDIMNAKEPMDDYAYDAFDDIADDLPTDKSNETKKIPLELSKKALGIDKETFGEFIDINCLNALITSQLYINDYDTHNYSQRFSAQIYKNINDQLENYFKLCYDKKKNIFNVKYSKPRHKWGRVFPNKSLGLTCFPKKIRNTLIKNNYIDLDISNAQPSILYNICKSNDILCPILTQYINDRENILSQVMKSFNVAREDAKKLFLRLSFFGKVKPWCDELKIKKTNCEFIQNYIKELTNIAEEFKNKNKELYDTARRQNKENTLGSFFSLYLQEYETRIMDCVINWLNNHTDITTYNNTKVLTYEYDGLKLLKEKVDKYGIDKLIQDIQKLVYDKLGFSITFEEKPIDNFYDIKYEPFKIKKYEEYKSFQTLIEPEEYFYEDYQYFINLELTTNNLSPTEDGLLFKKYYKQVFIKIDCGGQTKYFSKNKKDGFIDWTLLKSTPFGERVSKFKFINITNPTKGNGKIAVDISSFIDTFTREDMVIYRDIDFIPYLYKDEIKDTNIFNIFTGFRFQPLSVDAEPDYYNNIQPILTHLKDVLCSNNEDVFNYVINWLAHLIQRPCDKAGVPVILMKSEQGTGKNLFWDFMGQVMGKKYICNINNLDDLTNKFNTRTEGKLLNILNEIQNYGGNYKNNEKLKSILTDITQTIEPKGKEAYTINNYARSVMLTNNDWAAKISNDDRRYLPIDVSNHRKDDNEYFKNLADIINDDKNAELFFHYLIQVDISSFDIRKIPHTQLKEHMKWFNVENRPLYYLKEYITDIDDEDFENKLSSKDLFNEYCFWCEENKERQTFSQRTFTQQIIKYGMNYIRFKSNSIQIRGFNINKKDIKTCIEKTLRINNYNFDE
jgi:hypothetical protein